MNELPDRPDWRPRLQKLREEETRQAPSFETFWMRAKSRPLVLDAEKPAPLAAGWRGWMAFATLAVIPVIAAVFWMSQSARSPEQSVEWSQQLDDLEASLRAESSDWTSLCSPSDYLLAARQESTP